MVQPWTATCMQVYTYTVNSATNREEAMAIVNTNLDRWVTLAMGTARGWWTPIVALSGIRIDRLSLVGKRGGVDR